MTYVVLSRKLRPQRFQDLIGQDLAARALRNAVLTGRLAHAFLFAGSRGVGKTSAARILAKAINCTQPQQGEPCNACENCLEIGLGASPDVLEIDAASNRGIDNIRDLRENTKYAPAKCAYKTYIIDEVHMLTAESFNALLKTLEEPPPHVKFILATTHPQRVPDTILSRCQRYDFARIPLARMVDYLAEATRQEGLTLSRAALEAIARNSAGGMRDALTAVDQAVAFAGPSPGDQEVLDLLGLLDHRAVLDLLSAILDKALNRALQVLGAQLAKGHDLHTLLFALLRELKDLALYHALGADSAYFQDHLPGNLEFYRQRRGTSSLDELEQLFQVFLELEAQLKASAFAQACFEMALIKACRVQPLVGLPELLSGVRLLLGAEVPFSGVAGPGAGGAGSGRSRAAAVASSLPGPRERASAGAPLPRAGSGASSAEEDSAPEEPEPPTEGQWADPPGAPPFEVLPPEVSPVQPLRPDPVVDASGHGSAIGLAQPAPEAEALPVPQAAEDGEAPDQPAPCDDPRWIAWVQRVARSKPGLAAWLRTADVLAITENQVQVVRAGPPPSADEVAWLQPGVQEAFGPAFHVVVIDAKLKKPRGHFSLAGRREWRETLAVAVRRQQAEQDATVQRVRRLLPGSKVLRVDLVEPGAQEALATLHPQAAAATAGNGSGDTGAQKAAWHSVPADPPPPRD